MKKKKTISLQLTIVMLALVAGTIAFCIIMNTTMLGKYYIADKKNSLKEAYEDFDISNLSSNFEMTFDRICDTKNLHAYIQYPNSFICYGANPELMQYEFASLLTTEYKEADYLTSNDKYRIMRRYDSRIGLEYMVLFGRLSDGNLVFIRTPIESIDETVKLSNHFFSIVALISLGVSFLVIMLVARTIASPITRLNEISLKMTALDFDTKYEIKRIDSREISQLGHNMNVMSESLERTIAELKGANTRLQRDIQKKEEIDEMRKEFLSNVSHELKTPLALISGYAEGLSDGISEDEESRAYYCSVIIDEAERMNKMVKQLLSLNQLEFGMNQIEMTRFDMTELISGVLLVNQISIKELGVTVEFDDEKSVEVWADQFQTEQIITNFLTNALHYVDERKLIRISYTENNGILRVSVFNTGAQIPEESLDRVWEKFYKVDQARTHEYGGSGIGLSIVKAITLAHGRQCGVLNHEDGVEFWAEFDASLEK